MFISQWWNSTNKLFMCAPKIIKINERIIQAFNQGWIPLTKKNHFYFFACENW